MGGNGKKMIAYLKALGLSTQQSESGSIKLYVINNPDGSPRWIWNATNPHPDFLRFYAITSITSWFFVLAARLLFTLKLQAMVFRKNQLWASLNEGHPLAAFVQGNFAVFTGTAGPNRKLVLYARQQFVKIALSHTSAAILENEKAMLQLLKSTKHVEVPFAKQLTEGVLALSDLGERGERSADFSILHAKALAALQEQLPVQLMPFKEAVVFKNSLHKLQPGAGVKTQQIPHNLIEKLADLGQSLADKNFTFAWAHGDFTPWNCFVERKKINVYDFELAQHQLPFGYDAIHFVMQQGILVDRLSWKAIKPKVKVAFDLLAAETAEGKVHFEKALKAYLYLNTTYYAHLYSQQQLWHPQITWQLNTWNDAISDVLGAERSQRALLTGDVFDFLQNESYAAVKFPNIHPKALSELADIDLLSSKATAEQLSNYLLQHSLVDRIQQQKQSHMNTLLVVLHDGSLLALDLIWQLKRRELEFMSTRDLLSGIVQNDFGVKTLNEMDTKRYLQYFYILNGSTIPPKYKALFHSSSFVQMTQEQLTEVVKILPMNQGLLGRKNRFNYFLDLVRRTLQRRGIIITFSGVDGAGKSTIIEHTKNLLEKKFRRKVVVIRHRPSLLPILSAFTHGKAQAELNAAAKLPRQGTNKSLISSLLRFAYYYADYVFGQFYIYTKHVLRGDVVLYDRYYFDFINDSLRSNIRLPQWLTKAGYALLLQPQLNFFLYADAPTILSRKKELDAEAIEQLTGSYLQLFNELNAKSKGKYIPIFNLRLNDSLNNITAKIQTQLI